MILIRILAWICYGLSLASLTMGGLALYNSYLIFVGSKAEFKSHLDAILLMSLFWMFVTYLLYHAGHGILVALKNIESSQAALDQLQNQLLNNPAINITNDINHEELIILEINVLGLDLFRTIVSQNKTIIQQQDGGEIAVTIDYHDQTVAARLVFMERILENLQNQGLNQEQTVAWFSTKQKGLYTNQSPLELLSPNWHPDDPAAQKVLLFSKRARA